MISIATSPRKSTRPAAILTARDHAIAAIAAAHARHAAQWYPDGQNADGNPAPFYFATDLDHDRAAIASWPERAGFGWIVSPFGTHIVRAGDPDHGGARESQWRCLTCARVSPRGPGVGAPDACPTCGSERYPDHGPQIRCHLGRWIADAYRGNPIAFYTWDSFDLVARADADAFDRAVEAVASMHWSGGFGRGASL